MKQGEIYEVIKPFWISEDYTDNHPTNGRKIRCLIEKGEFIEIRFPYKWHFRTVDNIYCHATEETLLESCRYFGMINEQIKLGNKHKLKEILEQNLFEGFWQESEKPHEK